MWAENYFSYCLDRVFVVITGYIQEYWYVIISVLGLNALITRFFGRLRLNTSRKNSFILCTFTLFGIAFFARGGVALKPLNSMDAYAKLTNKEVTTDRAYPQLNMYKNSR